MSAVVELRSVGKRYEKLDEEAMLLRSILPFAHSARQDLWALRDVNLVVQQGETVGVLGHNGAGKTTLLRLLAGVTSPTEGHVRVVGRIAPLISLGVGFHQEMSGRENVLVNAMLLGLTAEQVAERFDEIVEFAELEDFIDTPVKFYSSGMFMRLGFAVVIHVQPQILLVDEILAVGDAGFQLKCFERLRSLQQRGAAVVMVSHSMHIIRQLCSRGILIRHGQIEYDGDIEQAIALHYESVSSDDRGEHSGVVEFLQSRLSGPAGESHHANYDEPMELHTRLRFRSRVEAPQLTFVIATDTGFPVMSQTTVLDLRDRFIEIGQELAIRIPFQARLGGGAYELSVQVRDREAKLLGQRDRQMLFVAGRPAALGVVDLCSEIEVDGVDITDRRSMLLEA